MLTVSILLILSALGTTIAAALGKCPVWIPLFIVVVVLMLGAFPIR